MTSRITLVLGGARSGKSDYAEKLAAEFGERVLYIATAEAGDGEMEARIKAHRQARPTTWSTLEAPNNVGAALDNFVDTPPDGLLLDCLTLLVSNMVLSMEEQPEPEIDAAVKAEIDAIVAAQRQMDVPLIMVSNEVGMGLVPPYPLGRVYRDVLGRANQHFASLADRVLLLVAGLPVMVKDG